MISISTWLFQLEKLVFISEAEINERKENEVLKD